MVDELVVRLHMFTLESIKANVWPEDTEILEYYEDKYLDTLERMYKDILKGIENS